MSPTVFPSSSDVIDREELEVRMIRVASRTDVGPRGPGLVLVADIVDEQEVRDDTFADGPDVLPAKGAIGLLAADGRGAVILVAGEGGGRGPAGGGRFTLVAVKVEARVHVEAGELWIASLSRVTQHTRDEGIHPPVVRHADRPRPGRAGAAVGAGAGGGDQG